MKQRERKIRLKQLNAHITCFLCKGYLVECTTITECLHTFCKSCIVKYLEEHNTCPICRLVIHQSHPLNYISYDRTMQDIVYKLVPNLQEKERSRQVEFYKKKGLAMPDMKTDPDADLVETPKPFQNTDYHRNAEQVNMCLECGSALVKPLRRKYVRCSALATITHIKKFISLEIFQTLDKYHDVEVLCNEEILGKDHTLKFIHVTRWPSKDIPLTLHYRPKMLL